MTKRILKLFRSSGSLWF